MAHPQPTLDATTPVVLIWPSIGVVRSLGRLGVPVYCVDGDPDSTVASSRYTIEAITWDLRDPDEERSVAFLASLAERIGGHPILLPADDHGAIFVARHAAALTQWYRMAHPSAELATALSNKQQMFELCVEHGIPTPDAVFPRTRAEVEDEASRAVFPLMLKGIDTHLQERRGKDRMAIVHSSEELLERYDEMESPSQPNLMLQEYIPGGPDSVWMFNGYFDGMSRCLFGGTGQKLRQLPPSTGATSLGVCRSNPTVERLTIEFMRAVGYRGILDIGFRFDHRDGLYKLLDVNPRIGATFRLFVSDSGMDVARAQHLDLTGRPVPSARCSEDRKWITEFNDLISAFHSVRAGDLRRLDWLRSFRGVQEACWLARDDLRPFTSKGRSFVTASIVARWRRWGPDRFAI